MEDKNDEEEWSESKAVKNLWTELFIRSTIYIAIMIVSMVLMENILKTGAGGERLNSGIVALLFICSCPVYVSGLMNRTGCEIKQLEFGILVAVLVSTLILCACAALMELSSYHYIVIGATGGYVIVGSMARYKYGDDD